MDPQGDPWGVKPECFKNLYTSFYLFNVILQVLDSIQHMKTYITNKGALVAHKASFRTSWTFLDV